MSRLWRSSPIIRAASAPPYGISLDTLYRWKREFSSVTKHDVQRVRTLEDENARLKRMAADQALNIQVLKDALGRGR